MPNSSAAFRDALAELPPEQFAAFVQAVWTARGREVSRTGQRVTVTDADGERDLYARAAGSDDPAPADVDLVVRATSVETEEDGDRIGPGDLHHLVRFAVPDAERAQLFAEHLGIDCGDPRADTTATEAEPDTGRSIPETDSVDHASEADPGDDSKPDTQTATGFDRYRPSRRTILVAAGAFLAGLGTAVVSDVDQLDPAGGVPNDTTSTPTPPSEPTVAVPGLSQSGVADPEVLSEAHLDRLEATSFSLSTIRTVHAEGGTLLSSLRVSARVDESRQFVAEIGTAGAGGRDVFGEPPVRATLYSDGDLQYRRLTADGETAYSAVPLGAGVNGWFYWTNIFPFGSLFYSSDEYYRDLFDAVPVSLTSRAGDGEPPYHLHATSVSVPEPNPQVFAAVDDESPVSDLALLASVTGAGFVDSLRLSYDGERFSDPATAQVSTDYRALGSTTVERPEWADRAESS